MKQVPVGCLERFSCEWKPLRIRLWTTLMKELLRSEIHKYALLVKGCYTALIGVFSVCTTCGTCSTRSGSWWWFGSNFRHGPIHPPPRRNRLPKKWNEHATDSIKRVLNELPYSYQFIAALSLWRTFFSTTHVKHDASVRFRDVHFSVTLNTTLKEQRQTLAVCYLLILQFIINNFFRTEEKYRNCTVNFASLSPSGRSSLKTLQT